MKRVGQKEHSARHFAALTKIPPITSLRINFNIPVYPVGKCHKLSSYTPALPQCCRSIKTWLLVLQESPLILLNESHRVLLAADRIVQSSGHDQGQIWSYVMQEKKSCFLP